LRQTHAAANRPVHRRRAGLIALLGAVVMLTVACSASSSASSQPAKRPIGGTTYYLSPSGSDAAAGISLAKAWRTLGRASRAVLRPGDRLLLEGGQQFSGQLTIGESDAGDVARPLTIGSYGDGPATIMSASFAIYVHDTSGVDITGLNVVGQPSGGGPPGPGPQLGGSNGAGVNIYNDLPAGHRLSRIVISHVYASGFDNGIAVGGGHSGAGFSDVQISDCLVSGNVDAGLESYGPQFDAESPNYANQNVTVSDVVASQNHGDPRVTSHNTGNGIVLGSVRDGTIEWSTADSNGGAGGDTAQGPTGIWAYDSTDVSIEHSLSYENQTANKVDGNGFGLDQNTSDSVLQDNLSYSNAGAGFLVYSRLNNGAQRDNVVRYNISSGDAGDGSTFDGGITIFGAATGIAVSAASVYQNTVVMTSVSSPSAPALRLSTGIRGITVRNNIFATDYGPVVAATQKATPAVAALQGNDYFPASGPWSVDWGAKAYDSLASWRSATSQESVAGQKTGYTVNPDLTGPVLGLQAKAATSQPSAGNGFVLRTGSPLLDAGLDLARFGLRAGPANYAGRKVSTQHPNVGAQ
jgi:hypothetical protein